MDYQKKNNKKKDRSEQELADLKEKIVLILDKMEEKFESKDWVSLVIDMSLSRETAFNWLKEVQTIGMIKKIKHGHYMKSGMKILRNVE